MDESDWLGDDFDDWDDDYDEEEEEMTQRNTITAKNLDEAKKCLIELAGEWFHPTTGRQGLTYGVVFDTNGTVKCEGRGYGCHGWMAGAWHTQRTYNLTTANYDKAAPPAFILSAFPGNDVVKHQGIDEKVIRRWAEWFASDDNPLSKFLMERDPDFLFNYGMIVNPEAQHTYALWLVKTFRQPVESPELVKFWGRMVLDEGIDPLLALYVAERYPFLNNGGIRPITGTGHYCTFKQGFDENLENLITRTLIASPEKSNCSNVFLGKSPGARPDYYPITKPTGPLDTLSKNHKIKSSWGNELTVQGALEAEIIKTTKALEADLRKKMMPPPAKEGTIEKPSRAPVHKVKMVRDKKTGLMRPARKRKAVAANGTVSRTVGRSVPTIKAR